jgi:cerevisin
MEQLLKLMIFLCLVFWHEVFAAPLKAHESGGLEHIVIIDKSQPIPPRVEDVLERLALNEKHPDVRHVFNNSAFHGFAASMKSHCLDKLSKMSDISHVEQATTVAAAKFDTRGNAPWGLQRISTSSKVQGNDHSLDFTYSFANQRLGYGADIYIVDTGIYTKNNVFGGRAKMLWSFDGDLTDNDGHGTHVSGTAGGNIVGVASNANIFGVKALDNDGGGWSSNVVAAIDHVIKFHDARKASGERFQGSVMSMSLASSANSAAMNSAISAAVKAGVHVVVAAGNDADDACNASPASAGGLHGPAITVGAVDIDSQRANFSNYGQCVDLYAPGVSVISSWINGPNMINTLSGTSMATPHVTGIVAYAMANQTLASDPALMKEWVRMTALYMSNEILLANNGIQENEGEGVLGFEKMAATAFDDAHDERPVRTIKKKPTANHYTGSEGV